MMWLIDDEALEHALHMDPWFNCKHRPQALGACADCDLAVDLAGGRLVCCYLGAFHRHVDPDEFCSHWQERAERT